jgi:phosphatidylglycerophosphate synthase
LADIEKPVVVAMGENPTLIWGMSNSERISRIASKLGLTFGDGQGPRLLVDSGFVFDPPLLRHMAGQPGSVLLHEGRPVIAHVSGPAQAEGVAQAMRTGARLPPGLEPIHYGEGFTLYNDELRKREQPFLLPLTPETVRQSERASYFGAYKGVTDLLTKYLWPEWALIITRLAARVGMTPNMVTGVGAVLCVLSFWLFWQGRYWEGLGAGLIFMVLDTVDGKLARCTITSSKLGNMFDHGIDLVHPPFWYWAWIVGLKHVGLPLTDREFAWVMGAILSAYVVQRLLEGAFIAAFKIHPHVWRPFDSRFRLITARRNPNMLILFLSAVAGRPDYGIIAVAAWAVISLVVHLAQLGQALLLRSRGREITSWLSEQPPRA